MGKKRAASAAVAAPVFPFPAAVDHFSDYGFDPQLVPFLSYSQRPSSRRHHPPTAPPSLESARFRLQKPTSNPKNHRNKQHQRRRWWSSAASAALVLFKRQSSSSSSAKPTAAAGVAHPGPAGPLYLAYVDDDDDGGYGNDGAVSSCACWAPAALRSAGHLQLAAAELGAASAASVPYVSLRGAEYTLGGGTGNVAGGGAAPPAMPIYLVT